MENNPNSTGEKEFSKDFRNLKICKRYDQVVTAPPVWRNFDRPIAPWSVLHLVYLLLTMNSFDTTIKLWCRSREVMGTSNQILTCAAKLRRIISKTKKTHLMNCSKFERHQLLFYWKHFLKKEKKHENVDLLRLVNL